MQMKHFLNITFMKQQQQQNYIEKEDLCFKDRN